MSDRRAVNDSATTIRPRGVDGGSRDEISDFIYAHVKANPKVSRGAVIDAIIRHNNFTSSAGGRAQLSLRVDDEIRHGRIVEDGVGLRLTAPPLAAPSIARSHNHPVREPLVRATSDVSEEFLAHMVVMVLRAYRGHTNINILIAATVRQIEHVPPVRLRAKAAKAILLMEKQGLLRRIDDEVWFREDWEAHNAAVEDATKSMIHIGLNDGMGQLNIDHLVDLVEHECGVVVSHQRMRKTVKHIVQEEIEKGTVKLKGNIILRTSTRELPPKKNETQRPPVRPSGKLKPTQEKTQAHGNPVRRFAGAAPALLRMTILMSIPEENAWIDRLRLLRTIASEFGVHPDDRDFVYQFEEALAAEEMRGTIVIIGQQVWLKHAVGV